jgi:hypothetical protein
MADLDLRDRLRALRRSALAQLAEGNQIDGGMLRLAAEIDGALAALEAETAEAVAPIPGDRALIVDDNTTVQIVVYSADRHAACATLAPVAPALGQVILQRTGSPVQPAGAPCRR